MKDIVILGAGGLAREVAWLIEEINRTEPRWRIRGHAVEDVGRRGSPVGPYRVEFTDGDLVDMDVALAVGIGNPRILLDLRERFGGRPPEYLPNLVHPSAILDAGRVELDVGTLVCAGAVLTTDIVIGAFTVVNFGCTIGHDAEIADGCILNPGCHISGGVKVGRGCLVGTGASVLQYLELGDGVTVGAGAVVTKSVAPGTTVVGVPARPLGVGTRS